jgi:hypothetical protein
MRMCMHMCTDIALCHMHMHMHMHMCMCTNILPCMYTQYMDMDMDMRWTYGTCTCTCIYRARLACILTYLIDYSLCNDHNPSRTLST